MNVRDRITINRTSLKWANALVTQHHYLHRPVHYRACPFAYRIYVDDVSSGTIIMATPHFVKKKDVFGYPGLPTKWQVLLVSRLWLNPRVQNLTVTDHHARQHTFPVATCALAQVLKQVQRDWIEHHPPRFLDRPYHIRLILAYADTGANHQGTIYKAANFKLWGETNNGRPRHGHSNNQSGTRKLLYTYSLSQPHWHAPAQGKLFK